MPVPSRRYLIEAVVLDEVQVGQGLRPSLRCRGRLQDVADVGYPARLDRSLQLVCDTRQPSPDDRAHEIEWSLDLDGCSRNGILRLLTERYQGRAVGFELQAQTALRLRQRHSVWTIKLAD
jgi:hypothetical protein